MSLRHLSPVLWIALFLCALEIGLELRASKRGWSTLLFDTAAEAGTESGPREFGPTETFPFRSRVQPRDQRSGPRLWLASSSYAEDNYQPVRVIFPNQLELRLREAGLPVSVLNASRSGYWTGSNLEMLRELGADWGPDVCVLYQMSNDIDWITNALLAPDAAPLADIGPESTSTGPPVPVGTIERISEETTIFSVLKSNLTSRLSAGRLMVDALPERADEVFESYVRAFVAESRRLGARPVLCTFATRHTQRTLASVPEEVTLALRRVNLHLSMRAWVDAVERFNEVLRGVAQAEDALLVDVAAVVADQPELFRDFSHLHESGHGLVAETLFEALRTLPELQPEEAQ